jgi:hypothetical protein
MAGAKSVAVERARKPLCSARAVPLDPFRTGAAHVMQLRPVTRRNEPPHNSPNKPPNVHALVPANDLYVLPSPRTIAAHTGDQLGQMEGASTARMWNQRVSHVADMESENGKRPREKMHAKTVREPAEPARRCSPRFLRQGIHCSSKPPALCGGGPCISARLLHGSADEQSTRAVTTSQLGSR